MAKNNKSYLDRSHTIGRWGEFLSMTVMLAIPIIICSVYDVWPTNWKQFFINCAGLISVFGVINIAGVISYTPILGTGIYISQITGNLTNLKLPCALNAIELADAPLGTEESDVIGSMAIALSSLLTIVIVLIGVMLLIPLQPLMTMPVVQTAMENMLPALFGSMLLGIIFNNKSGKFIIQGQPKMVVLPMLVVLAIHFFIMPINGKEGIMMLLAIPMLLLSGKLLIAKGMVKLVPAASKEDAPVPDSMP